MEKLNNCPICNDATLAPFMSCVDYTVSRETFQIEQCGSCGFKFTNPRPAALEIGKYYESADYISHSNSKKGVVNKLYHSVRKYTIRKKVALIEDIAGNSNKRILDIGSGTGEFLNAVKTKDGKRRGSSQV